MLRWGLMPFPSLKGSFESPRKTESQLMPERFHPSKEVSKARVSSSDLRSPLAFPSLKGSFERLPCRRVQELVSRFPSLKGSFESAPSLSRQPIEMRVSIPQRKFRKGPDSVPYQVRVMGFPSLKGSFESCRLVSSALESCRFPSLKGSFER